VKPKTEIAIECAKFAVSDEGVFSYDQIKSLEDMINALATALEEESILPTLIDVSHKVK